MYSIELSLFSQPSVRVEAETVALWVKGLYQSEINEAADTVSVHSDPEWNVHNLRYKYNIKDNTM